MSTVLRYFMGLDVVGVVIGVEVMVVDVVEVV